jgi:glutamate racemase
MKIGIIDSGIGGIDLLNKLINKYPNNEFIYLCDNLNLPYGTKTKNEVLNLLKNILNYLEKECINLLIVACNTMSCFIDEIKHNYSYPIYTILDYNLKLLNNKYQNKKVSIIATALTIRSESYLFNTSNIDIQFINGSYLTKLIEDDDETLIENEITSLIKQISKDSDAVLLGCTHYGLYKNLFINKKVSKIFIEASKDLIYDLPIKYFESPSKLSIYLTNYNEKYINKINKFIKNNYTIHKVKI